MRRILIITLLLLALFILSVGFALAEGYTWRDHTSPFDFLFGNHIDSHQQTELLGNSQLQGFFYIRFTGEYIDGYPEAKHANCDEVAEECIVGWTLHGIPMSATFIAPGTEQKHPTWCVDPADLPEQRGYSHFHWLGLPAHAHDLVPGNTYDGFLLKLTARETFYFPHHGDFVVTPGIDTVTHANIVTECN